MSEERYAYILVEDEKWWNRRCTRNNTSGSIHSFVRRGKVGPKNASRLLFYIKLPVKQIKGFGEFVERLTGTRDDMWNHYGTETIFEDKEEYDKFVGDRSSVTLIRFRNMEELDRPISFQVLNAATGVRKMPNGGMYISRDTLNQIIGGGA